MGKKASKKYLNEFIDDYNLNVDVSNANASTWDEAIMGLTTVFEDLNRRVELLEEDLDDAHVEIEALKSAKPWYTPTLTENTERIKDFFAASKADSGFMGALDDAVKGTQSFISEVSSLFSMNDPYNKNKSNDEG